MAIVTIKNRIRLPMPIKIISFIKNCTLRFSVCLPSFVSQREEKNKKIILFEFQSKNVNNPERDKYEYTQNES